MRAALRAKLRSLVKFTDSIVAGATPSALAVSLAAGIFLGVTVAFRVSGHWRGAVSEGEYARRLQEIDSPLYTHVGGMTSAETRPGTAPLVQAHGSR